MMAATTATVIDDARSVGRAADSLARAIRRDGNVDGARERLREHAEVAVEGAGPGRYAATGIGPADEVVLAECLSQLSIGTTLLTAESALTTPSGISPDALRAAVASLDDTTRALADETAPPPTPRRFDTSLGGVTLDVRAATVAALDEMSEAAATAATALVDRAMKPLVESVPETVRTVAENLLPSGGQLAQWGLRAVQRGLELLTTLVDLETIDRLRDRIDDVLRRLGQGEDTTVLLGAAIGADAVRDALAPQDPSSPPTDDALVAELARLAARYERVCRLLRRVAGALVGVAAALASFGVVSPQVAALSALGFVVVLGAVIVLGRDHTGATDLPGRTRGVRLIVPMARGASA